MSKKIYITYGDEKYAKSREFGVKMAKRLGKFDVAIGYTESDIPIIFKEQHEEIFKIKRGAGLWLWKPFLILKTLIEFAVDDDIVFYSDGGAFMIRNISFIIKSMGDSDIWVSDIPFKEKQFTKEDAFHLMNTETINRESPQIQASFLCFRKSGTSVAFVREWLKLCCDINLLHPSNLNPGLENGNSFIAHREDQSILSLLCKKRGIVAHLDPSQHGKYPVIYTKWGYEVPKMNHTEEYPICIILHRRHSINVIFVLKWLLLSFLPQNVGMKILAIKKVSHTKKSKMLISLSTTKQNYPPPRVCCKH